MRTLFLLLGLASLSACGSEDDPETPAGPDCDPSEDADGDGLDDCREADLGTDPEASDSDGDGLTDLEEVDCVSDPLDAEEQCFACGWPHADPGTIEATGEDEGDVAEDFAFVDQCGEEVSLYDLADAYNILFMTASWCGACLAEAEHLQEWQQGFAEDYGIPMRYAVVLFEDRSGALPDAEEAAWYAQKIPDDEVPVLSDGLAAVIDGTPYRGNTLPGRCLLSPEMEILSCKTGHGDDAELYAQIVGHSGE